MVIGVEIMIDKLNNLKGTSQKKSRLVFLDGRMDPNAFFDWLVAIEDYFDWYEMIDSKWIRFAKMKLTNLIKMY